MRLSYVPNPPTAFSPEDQDILERIQTRRGAAGLLSLDLTLLHAPKIADGWNSLLGAVRTKSSLSAGIREIAICRVALVNRAWFEWKHHAPLLEKFWVLSGDKEAKMSVVMELRPKSKGALSEREWVVLRYADAMTRDVSVSQALFDEVKAVGFDPQEIVELTATVASYNMVSRFLVALEIGEQDSTAPEWAKENLSRAI